MVAKQEVASSDEVKIIRNLWAQVIGSPDNYLVDMASTHQVLYAAGGALPSEFGDSQSEIWQKMVKAAGESEILKIAGINFNIKDLEAMGKFYKWLREKKGYRLHCIDERLDESEENHACEVHESCGACSAVKQAIMDAINEVLEVEDKLLESAGQDRKQPLRESMRHNHDSLTILVSYSGASAVKQVIRQQFEQKRALPFNVTMPLELIMEWAKETGESTSALIETMAAWNVQISKNIIAGHNKLSDREEAALLIEDERGVSDGGTSLMNVAKAAVHRVEVGERLSIPSRSSL